MSSLFEITDDLIQLLSMLDDPETEVDEQAIMDTWEGLEGEFNDKVEQWCKVIQNRKADIAAREQLIKDQTAKNDSDKKTIERMQNTLITIMQSQNIKKAGTAILSASVAGNGGKKPLKWADGYAEDFSKLPFEYQKIKTTYSADQDKIREALDNGETLDFVQYGERGVHLNIK